MKLWYTYRIPVMIWGSYAQSSSTGICCCCISSDGFLILSPSACVDICRTHRAETLPFRTNIGSVFSFLFALLMKMFLSGHFLASVFNFRMPHTTCMLTGEMMWQRFGGDTAVWWWHSCEWNSFWLHLKKYHRVYAVSVALIGNLKRKKQKKIYF